MHLAFVLYGDESAPAQTERTVQLLPRGIRQLDLAVHPVRFHAAGRVDRPSQVVQGLAPADDTGHHRTSSMLRTRISTSARSNGSLMKSFAPASALAISVPVAR